MSFKTERFFSFMMSFFIGSFFLVSGVLSIILAWSALMQNMTTQLILERPFALSLIGFALTLIGLSIVTRTLLKTRHRYVQVQIGKLGIFLDENVIHQYLETYWQKQFPNSSVRFNLGLKRHSLQIIAHLPFLPLPEQKVFLERVKQDFSDLFGRVLGYPYDVQLLASFQQDKGMVQI